MKQAFLFLIGLALAHPITAQDYTTDAFGVFHSKDIGIRENWAGLRVHSDGSTTAHAGQTAETAIIFVGPKSIVAGIEDGHAVVLALDEYGNMLDGATTTFNFGTGQIVQTTSTAGIADFLFRPSTRAGTFLAGAEVETVQSSRADYRVTAHLATVEPTFVPQTGPFASETFGKFSSNYLVDAYGNAVDDGVGLSVILADDLAQSTIIPSVVRDGFARGVLLSRDIQGALSGKISLAGQSAETSRIEIGALSIDNAPVTIWSLASLDAIGMQVGPITTDADYLLPDGAELTVTTIGNDDDPYIAQGWVLDGFVRLTLPKSADLAPFDVTVKSGQGVLETQVTVSEPPSYATPRGAE